MNNMQYNDVMNNNHGKKHHEIPIKETEVKNNFLTVVKKLILGIFFNLKEHLTDRICFQLFRYVTYYSFLNINLCCIYTKFMLFLNLMSKKKGQINNYLYKLL